LSANLAVAPDTPEETQLEFFDPALFNEPMFSLQKTSKFPTPRELKPRERVTGRFSGVVDGLVEDGFNAINKDGTYKDPSKVFVIQADYVELDA
jgi:hypothetical protein